MFRTFNMGVGYVVVVPFESAEYAARTLVRAGEESMYLGAIVRGEPGWSSPASGRRGGLRPPP